LRAPPGPGRMVRRGDQHRQVVTGLLGGQENEIVEVVTGEAVLCAHPAFARVLGCKETLRAGYKPAIFAMRERSKDVDVQVVDTLVHFLPGLAAVETAQDAAMLQAEIDHVGVIWMDVDTHDVAEGWW